MRVVNCNLGPRFLAISSRAEVMNLFCITIIQIDSLPHDGNIQEAVVVHSHAELQRGDKSSGRTHLYVVFRSQRASWWLALLSTMLSPRLHKSICGSRYFVPFFHHDLRRIREVACSSPWYSQANQYFLHLLGSLIQCTMGFATAG